MRTFGALLLVVLGACSGRHSDSSPEGAVRMLIASTRAGDRAGVYARLGPATRARIEAMQAAARRTSGRVVLKPEDYLSVGWAPPVWEPSGMRTLSRNDQNALVEVFSAAGDRHTVTLVREGPGWRVELP